MLSLIEKLNKIEVLLMSGISSAFLTHLFYRFKLKSEQRIRFQNIIGDRISESLIELRELIGEAAMIERYDIINPDESDERVIDAFHGTIYPAVMGDMNTLISFTEKINDVRKKHEKNLDCKTALHLWYGSRYFTQLLIYISKEGYQNQLPELGTMFIFDIQKWHLSFDKILVKRINKPLNKIDHHQGKKWAWHRRRFIKIWEKSLLYESINDFLDDKPVFTEFFEYLDELKNQDA